MKKTKEIKVARFTTTSELVYQNVSLVFDIDCQVKQGVGEYLTANYVDQIVVKTEFETIVMPDWSLALLEIRKMKPKHEFDQIKRITVSGVQFSPAFIINKTDWNKNNIPLVSDNQIAFIADNNLYITKQASITEIVI
jgi:hypothetical protein